MSKIIAGVIVLLVVLFIVFLFISGIYAIVAWSFGLIFSWKYAIGVSIIWVILVNVFKRK